MSSHWLLQSQKDFARLLTGSIVAQAIVIVAVPVTSRLYAPAAMGEFLFLFSIASIVGGVSALRLDSAVHVARDDAELAAVLATACLAALVLSVAAPLLYAGRAAWTGESLGPKLLVEALVMLAMALAHGVRGIAYASALRAGRADLAARAGITKSWVLVLGQVGFGLIHPSAIGLLLAEVASTAAMLLALRGPLRAQLATPVPFDATVLGATLRRCRRFVALECPATLLSELVGRLPILAIMLSHGPDKAGLFGVAYQIVQLPNRHIGGNLGDVVQMHAGRLVREDRRPEVAALLARNARLTAITALLPLLATLALAQTLFPIILGPGWGATGGIAQALAPWMFAALVVPTLARVLLVMERQDIKLVFDACLLAVLLTVFAIAAHAQADLVALAWALSAAHVAAYGIYFLVIHRTVQRFARVRE